jgi:hypothetical protein
MRRCQLAHYQRAREKTKLTQNSTSTLRVYSPTDWPWAHYDARKGLCSRHERDHSDDCENGAELHDGRVMVL